MAFHPKLFSIFLFIFSLFLINAVSSEIVKSSFLAGGWQPITNPNDPEVVEIGKFAVSQHNKEAETKLEFVSVVKGSTQVVNGINYRLVVSAKDGSATGKYVAVVWDKASPKSKTLVSFKKLLG